MRTHHTSTTNPHFHGGYKSFHITIPHFLIFRFTPPNVRLQKLKNSLTFFSKTIVIPPLSPRSFAKLQTPNKWNREQRRQPNVRPSGPKWHTSFPNYITAPPKFTIHTPSIANFPLTYKQQLRTETAMYDKSVDVFATMTGSCPVRIKGIVVQKLWSESISGAMTSFGVSTASLKGAVVVWTPCAVRVI